MKNTNIEELLKADTYSQFDFSDQIRPKISPVEYYRLSNMEFNWVILNPISIAVRKFREANNIELPDSVKIISSEQKMLYFWWYLDGQVNNGGFRQFISNGYDKYFLPILNGLSLLPNKKYYNLIESVFLYFLKQKKYIINETPDYFKEDFLSEADSEYFNISDQLYKDIELFIRDNQKQFIQEIDKDYTGLVEYEENGFSEKLEVIKGVSNGKYQMYNNSILIEEIIYKDGVILIEKKFKDGVLFEQIQIVENLKQVSTFSTKGYIYSINTNSLDSQDSRFSIEVFYDNGLKKSEIWMDDSNLKHFKRYFADGTIRSYHTTQKLDDGSYNDIQNFLICFDEERNETITNGTGIFYSYGFKEDSLYGFHKSIITCQNHFAHGEYISYSDDILISKTTYLNGFQNGLRIEYDENGGEKEIREYVNGTFIRMIEI